MPHTIHEEILSYMILSENEGQVGYPMLKEAAKISWYSLFKKTKESIVRKWVPIENGIINYPASVENLLGIYVCNSSGELSALYEDNFKSIVERPKEKVCNCGSSSNAPFTVNMVGQIAFSEIGEVGEGLAILVNDPLRGSISLGTYYHQPGDTTTAIFTANVASALSQNNYGYTISVVGGVINVTAPQGGASLLSMILYGIGSGTTGGVFDNSFDNTFN